jgi:hypothetical protein
MYFAVLLFDGSVEVVLATSVFNAVHHVGKNFVRGVSLHDSFRSV